MSEAPKPTRQQAVALRLGLQTMAMTGGLDAFVFTRDDWKAATHVTVPLEGDDIVLAGHVHRPATIYADYNPN